MDILDEEWVREYILGMGYDPDKLDELTEEEYESLLSDGQIDAYLKGKLDAR